MPTMRPTVSLTRTRRRALIEEAIRNRAKRLSGVLTQLDVDCKVEVIAATFGEYPDDATAVAIFIGLDDDARRRLIVSVLIAGVFREQARHNNSARLHRAESLSRIRCSCIWQAYPPTAARR